MSHLTTTSVVKLNIPNELGFEKIPIVVVALAAQAMGFSPERIENLKMALGEAVTNAIEHGNQLDAAARVLVVLTMADKSLTLDVIDQGQQPIPDIPTERQKRTDYRGWGMELIKRLTDEVTVEAAPGRNEIRMVAYLEQ